MNKLLMCLQLYVYISMVMGIGDLMHLDSFVLNKTFCNEIRKQRWRNLEIGSPRYDTNMVTYLNGY